jgi:hypothetical protein
MLCRFSLSFGAKRRGGPPAAAPAAAEEGGAEAEAEAAEEARGDQKPGDQKPEVFFLRHSPVGHSMTEYKCWAASEEAMLELVRRVAELKGEAVTRSTSLKKRQVACEPVADDDE